MILEQLEDGPAGAVARRGTVQAIEPAAPLRADLAQQRKRLLDPVLEQLRRCDFAGVVALAERQVAAREEGLEPLDEGQLVGGLSSMLMRSIASVYSPIRGSGMTTSSLILKALVCLLIAAVR